MGLRRGRGRGLCGDAADLRSLRGNVDGDVQPADAVPELDLKGIAGRREAMGGRLCRVLRDAVDERPVLLLDLDKTDENVFAAKAGVAREIVGDGGIERLLLVDGPCIVAGYLNEDQIIAVVDA